MAQKNKVLFDILANTKNYSEGMSKTVSVTEVATKAMQVGFLALSATAIGATVAFAKFEKGMSDISTIIDNSTESVKNIGGEILQLSKKVPKPISELVQSMYDIRSAGVSAADAMGTLNSAGKLATVGLSTTKEATDILTTSMNVFASEGLSATQISNILFKTVKYGKNTISELAQAFGQTAPLAKSAGVSLTEFSAATAALTAQGIPASVAQNQLRAAMVSLEKQTAEMKKVFRKLGYKDMKELMANSKNLGDAFKKIRAAAVELDIPLTKVTGRVEGANAITVIATEGAAIYTKALLDMQGGVDAVDEAFKGQSATLMAQKQLILNMVNAVFINLGSKLQPSLISIGDNVIKFFEVIDNAINVHGKSITSAMQEVSNIGMSAFSILKSGAIIVADLFKAFGGYQIITAAAIAIKITVKAVELLFKAISTITTALNNMIADLGAVGTAMKIVLGIMGLIQAKAFAGVIIQIVTATKLWKAAMSAFNIVMKANPIALIATAVLSLGVLIYDIIVNFNEWKLTFSSLINDVIIGWKKAKAIFASGETKQALEEEISAIEKENLAIEAQTEALKKRKEELMAQGATSMEADKQAGAELDSGQLKAQEEEKTSIQAQGSEARAENEKKAQEASYITNEANYNREKAAAESKFNEDLMRAKDNEEAQIAAKEAYQQRQTELDVQYRAENLAIDDERKALDAEREIEFQNAQLDRKIASGLTEREATNTIKRQEYPQKMKMEKDFQVNKQKMGTAYAKAKMATDKFYNNQAVKGFSENAGTLTQMADSKNKTLAGIGKAAAIAKIAVETPRAAMSAYAALAAIPIVGPALGIAAAAAAIAYGAEQISRVRSASYAVGTDFVPSDMPANVHKGEGIIPTKENQFLQSGKLALVSPDMMGSSGTNENKVENNYYTDVNFDGANIYGDVDDEMADKFADKIANRIEEGRFAGFPQPEGAAS